MITPASGTVADSLTATIGCATSGAVIRYTTDGSDPTGTSPVASAPIAITQNTTVKAIAPSSRAGRRELQIVQQMQQL